MHATITSVSFSPDGKLAYAEDEGGKILAWDASTGQLQPDALQAMPEKLLTKSPDGKLYLDMENGVPYVERLDNRVPDGLSPQQRWDRERLARWAAWNPA